MENRNLLATLLLILTGITYNTASRPQSNSPSEAAAKNAQPGRPDARGNPGPWDMIADFLRERKGVANAAGPEALIAILPDPVNTHLAVFFDRGIESLQNAATAETYGFDRYWIPWRANPYNATDQPEVLRSEEVSEQARENEPGVLLFRGGGEHPRDLVLFVVGETPTGGINALQFCKAVAYLQGGIAAKQTCDTAAKPPVARTSGDAIRIVGPTFSGSLPSLAAAIRAAPQGRQFRVVSGSTTVRGAMDSFIQALAKLNPPVEFHTAVHSDMDATCAFFHRVSEKASKTSKAVVAVLSEGDTAYGAALADNCKIENIDLISLPFPREISRLRNVYREEALAAPVSDSSNIASRNGITVTLKDSNGGRDSVPSFSQQTQVSHDSVLQSLAAVLRREEVQYAAIVATDPLDALFLARYLSANAPNIRLYQENADLLFVHSPESIPLAGTLSVTTYPMFARNQYWTGQEKKRLVFASRHSQGVYNAATYLLDGRGEHLVEYSSPWAGGNVAPLWLTAAGRNSYWPIAILKEDAGERMFLADQAKSPQEDPLAEDPSHLDVVFISVVFLIAGLILIALLWPEKSNANWLSDFQFKTGKRARAPYMLVCVLSLASVALCLVGPLWRLHALSGWESLSLLPSVLLVASAVILAPRAFRDQFLLTFTVWVAFAGFVWIGHGILTSGKYHQDYFLAYRALNFSSGLSPSLPLIFLFAAYAVWGWVHWQRSILLEERAECFPEFSKPAGQSGPPAAPAGPPTNDSGPTDPMARAANSVGNVFRRIFCTPIAYSLMLLGPLVFWVIWPHVHTPEHQPYDPLYVAALAVLCCLIALTACQFLLGWIRLERLLYQIEFHPIRSSLCDLPPDRSLAPIWQGNIRKRSYVLLTRSLDCLRALAYEAPAFVSLLEDELKKLEEPVRSVTASAAAGGRDSENQITAMGEAVRIAECLAGKLGQGYWSHGGSETVPPAPAASDDRACKLAAEFVALCVLSYVRYVMLHLSNLLGFLTTGFLLVVVSLNSYPFQAPEVIAAFVSTLFVALGALVTWVFLRMNGNTVLKLIKSTRGKEKRDFSVWVRLIETGGLPLLAVVASNIPGAGQFLFSWIGPLMDRIH